MGKIIRIEASAGSGKTRALATHFLKLLSEMEPSKENLNKVLAITFTNKAAEEMKERIIKYLKEISFETEEGSSLANETGLDRKRARKWLDVIVENFDSFNVKTIDSFIFSLFKAISFDLKISSDLDVTFNIDREISRAFDVILSNIDKNKDIIEKALLVYLQTAEDSISLYPEVKLKRLITDIYKHNRNYINELEDLEISLKELANKIDILLEVCEKLETKETDKVPKSEKEKLEYIIEKLRKVVEKNSSSSYYMNLYKEAFELSKTFLAYKVSGYVPILKEIRSILDKFLLREGRVKGGDDWTRIVAEKVREEGNIPLIYAYIGGKLHHILFDEFQDTSREQWDALKPLLENVLSEGGTLLIVGDKKQAIYAWRGGDATLFDSCLEDLRSAHLICQELTKNFRSKAKIVDFVNKSFHILKNNEEIFEIIDNIFKSYDKDIKEILSHRLAEIYSNVHQECHRASDEDLDNIVNIEEVDGENPESINDLMKQKVVEIIKKEVKNGINHGDIAVLLRSNEEVKEYQKILIINDIPSYSHVSLQLEKSKIVKFLLNTLRLIYNRNDKVVRFSLTNSRLIDKPIEAFLGRVKRRVLNINSPYEMLAAILEETGVSKRLEDDLAHERPFVEMLLEIAHQYECDQGTGIRRFVEFIEGESPPTIGLPEAVDAVLVSTIHRVKGLEFPVVIVPYRDWSVVTKRVITVHEGKLIYLGELDLLERDLKMKKFDTISREFIELINLFYVAITRAQDKLYIIIPKKASRKSQSTRKLIERMINYYVESEKITTN
ncbi:MAG: UvrD-helicase domain-containing protein [Thermosulfidibacteraceae bacterium]|jgi:ATP-dependent exoDNAse (exonuclease V) beta subunit